MLEALLRGQNFERKEDGGNRLTIAIEGSVCAGKSTLLGKIGAQSNASIVSEYMIYRPAPGLTLHKFPPQNEQEARENFSYFLEVEKLRKRDYGLSLARLKYLDRSIFTLLAFELGLRAVYGINIFDWGYVK